MNREQVKEVFKILAFAYPRFEVSSEKIDFWQKYLSDQDPARVMQKAEKHVMDKPFPPTIADLREAKREYNDIPVIAEFWKSDVN
jgi:hypothetical protein